jgi:hypothetical protein
VHAAISRAAARQPPRIYLLPPLHWWFATPVAVNQAVERHAANAERLARSGRAARHLFVLIEPVSAEAWGALVSGELPKDPPQLPEAITTAWAAGYQADGGPVVWCVHRTGRWEFML